MDSTNLESQTPVLMMSMKTLNVMRDQKTGEVTITNNGNADVKTGSFVKWNVTGPGIKKIEIVPGSKGNTDHDNIWAVDPAPFGPKSWLGQVVDETDVQGYYSVIWFDEYNTPHVIDPLIKVNQ